jgi:uncharacterized membrane protein YkvA (DUF1232 family)
MSTSEPSAKETQFYQKLRRTVRVWVEGDKSRASQYADLILAGPDLFMLLVRLSRDNRVSQSSRIRLAGAAAYFINPLDLIPEIILGPAGLLDDVALSGYVLHEVLENTDPTIIREHWEGDADILELIRRILAVADTMLGGPVWRRLIARAESFVSTT